MGLEMKSFKTRKQKIYLYKDLYHCKSLVQVGLKKGKKEQFEKIFKKALVHYGKDKRGKYFWDIMQQAVRFTTPSLNVGIRRFRNKYHYTAKAITKNQQLFYSSSWLYKAAVAERSNKSLHESLIKEIINASEKQGYAINQCKQLLKLAMKDIPKAILNRKRRRKAFSSKKKQQFKKKQKSKELIKKNL